MNVVFEPCKDRSDKKGVTAESVDCNVKSMKANKYYCPADHTCYAPAKQCIPKGNIESIKRETVESYLDRISGCTLPDNVNYVVSRMG
ncbi:hypothetical protein BGX29_010002 [Mortierella sp. GBA35]|nr:hypothetical protein BGX29_010002 [Mortierella sp. GBA35]